MQIKILAEGGNMKPGPALSQQLGPAGINISQVISKVNESTKDFKGLTVPVTIDIDMSTKNFEITVSSPPVSGLLKKELGIEKGSGEQKKLQSANASIEQIISVAKQKFSHMLCKDLKSAVKTVAGTCASLGILIENKPAIEIATEIEEGKYDNEINAEKTETPPEKRQKLDAYFADVHGQQEKLKKQEEAEKEAAEVAKAPKAEAGKVEDKVEEKVAEKK